MNDNEKLDLILSKMQGFEQRFDKLEQRFDGLEQRFDGLEQRFDGLEQRFDGLEQRFDGLEQRFDGLEQRFDKLEQRTDNLEKEIRKINLTLENVTNRNISIIAEGHLDLSRKLNECIRLSSDIKDKQEIQDIYINMHNSKLKAL